jgi:hypothetical protein
MVTFTIWDSRPPSCDRMTAALLYEYEFHDDRDEIGLIAVYIILESIPLGISQKV